TRYHHGCEGGSQVGLVALHAWPPWFVIAAGASSAGIATFSRSNAVRLLTQQGRRSIMLVSLRSP
ncbi:MAG: hypothetical protein ACI91Q_001760, partial [Gammaproteobacteria bacterium]